MAFFAAAPSTAREALFKPNCSADCSPAWRAAKVRETLPTF
jgi:hypothetical protein